MAWSGQGWHDGGNGPGGGRGGQSVKRDWISCHGSPDFHGGKAMPLTVLSRFPH
jgi:hypothetical protein